LWTLALGLERNQLFNFFLGLDAMIIETILDQEVRVEIMLLLLVFKPGDQTVETLDQII